MILIDGEAISAQIRAELKDKLTAFRAENGTRKPEIAFILAGENPASLTYVKNKRRACAEIGIESLLIELESSASESLLLDEIAKLNKNPNVDGILIQLPLPPHINPHHILAAIDPGKDVDGFHPVNAGKLLLGERSGPISCTPKGIIRLLEKMNLSPSGKHVVILGRSNIVGKPLAALLLGKGPFADATVTVAHSKTVNLTAICKSADILIAAIGRANFVDSSMVKPGAIVIDVGINREESCKKIVGDVNFDSVAPICSYITPVPGGVGPMTIAMLLENTLLSYFHHLNP